MPEVTTLPEPRTAANCPPGTGPLAWSAAHDCLLSHARQGYTRRAEATSGTGANMNNQTVKEHADDSLELTARLRAQTRRLMDETERLANQPAWVPWLQALAFVGGALLVARGLIVTL